MFRAVASLAVLVLSLGVSVPAKADGPLSADQIRQVLTGNTVVWNNGGTTQKQYFDARGYSIYEDQNQKADKGLWTVTSDNLFCSRWSNQTGWVCYSLNLQGANLYWSGPVNSYSPENTQIVASRLVRGNETSFTVPTGPNGDALVASVTQELSGGF